MTSIVELETIAAQVRRDIIRMVHSAKSGHPGGSLGCTDFLTALFFEIMDIDPKNFTQIGNNEDMFFISNGHLTPVLYSVMARRGYFPIEELKSFRLLSSRLQGHPTPAKHLPGIRISSGSLGQGISVAIGASLAKKYNHDPKTVFVLTGDGELEEGQIWESLLFASANKIDNLITIVDYNNKQIDGSTDDVCSLGNLKSKFLAFDWEVLEMNGNSMDETVKILKYAKTQTGKGKPVIIIMHTEMGMGVDFMMGTHKWHGTPPNNEQAAKALAQLPETIGDY